MRGLESMMNTFGSNTKSASSRVGFTAIENEMKKDRSFAQEMAEIASDKSISTEHYIALFATKSNEAVIMSHYFNNMVKNRYRRVRTIQEIVKSKANRSREAAEDLIHVYSIEGFKEFMKDMWNGIKTLIKKVIAAIASFVKMIATAIRTKFAGLQNKFYADNKDKLAEALKKDGSKTIKFKAFDKQKVPFTASQMGSELQDLENAAKTLDDLVGKVDNGKEDSITSSDAIDKVKSQIAGKSEVAKDLSTKEMANLNVFGEKKQPESKEHTISDYLTADSFQMCSKEWLEKFGQMSKASRKLMGSCNKLLSAGDKAMKKAEKDAKDDAKKELKKQMSGISQIRLAIHYCQNYYYDYFWNLLDVRSSIYRMAKAVIKGKGKDSKDNKDDKKS